MSRKWTCLKHLEPERLGEAGNASGLILLVADAIVDYCGWDFFVQQFSKTPIITGHFDSLIPYDIQIAKVEQAFLDLQLGSLVGIGLITRASSDLDESNLTFCFDIRLGKTRWGKIGDNYVTYEEVKKSINDGR